MRILQINASYKPAYVYGGPTMSVSKLSEVLVKSGCDVEVFTTTANGPAELSVIKNIPQQVDGVQVRYFKRITKDHIHFSPQLLIDLWKEVRLFDVVHIHAWWNLVSVLSCLIALLRRVPVVFSPRGTVSIYSFENNHISIKKLLHNVIGRYLLNHCFIHTTSAREQTAISKLLKPKSIFTIHNFVQFPPQTLIKENEDGVFKLLFLSRVEKKKGMELLFEALALVSIPYQLTIAGSGEEKYIAELKELSKQYRIENKINWVGFQADYKFELIAAHHLLVLPSYDENFGNVVIESLAMGTAVLISKEVGLAKYIEDNKFGWICETNALSIRRNLIEVYHSTKVLNAIRQVAPNIIRRDFNEGQLIKQYLKMYQKITAVNKQSHD